jgi:hypothetical protein
VTHLIAEKGHGKGLNLSGPEWEAIEGEADDLIEQRYWLGDRQIYDKSEPRLEALATELLRLVCSVPNLMAAAIKASRSEI